MGLYDNLNSAWQVHDVMRQFAEQQEHENRMMQASIARKEKMIDAQLGSAEDIRKMLEMMEADQKEQAEENKRKTRRIESSLSKAIRFPLRPRFLAVRPLWLRS